MPIDYQQGQQNYQPPGPPPLNPEQMQFLSLVLAGLQGYGQQPQMGGPPQMGRRMGGMMDGNMEMMTDFSAPPQGVPGYHGPPRKRLAEEADSGYRAY